MSNVLSSPLKYPGGKSFLVFQMAQIWKGHQHRQWCDLFCGSLALPLALRPERAMLNDINPDLIHFWTWIKTDGNPTMNFDFNQDDYYKIRNQFNNEKLGIAERAQIFCYLNHSCYNGLVRYSQKEKKFNVPIGRYKNVNYHQDFSKWQQAIAGWEFTNLDFRQAIEKADKDSFIYADPPYYGGGFAEYYGKFTWKEQVDLAHSLAGHPGPVVASNNNSGEIRMLYNDLGFDIQIVEAPRSINCQTINRKKVEELLITKNLGE